MKRRAFLKLPGAAALVLAATPFLVPVVVRAAPAREQVLAVQTEHSFVCRGFNLPLDVDMVVEARGEFMRGLPQRSL